MINESRGTPDILINVINNNIKTIIECIINKKESYQFNIDDKIYINRKNINFIVNINILFNYNSDRYHGNIDFKKCIDSDFNICDIVINIPKNNNNSKLVKLLSHELTHLYELYQLKEVFNKSSWKRYQSFSIFDRTNEYKFVSYLRDVFYCSLPQEIRSCISSIRFYLYDYRNNRKLLLYNLKQTIEWDIAQTLKDFDYKSYYNDVLKQNNIEDIIFGINYFNIKMDIKIYITNKQEFLDYLKKISIYFNKVGVNFEKKLLQQVGYLCNVKEDNKHYDKEVNLKYLDYIKEFKDDFIEYKYFF